MKNNLTKKEISEFIFFKFGISYSFSKEFLDNYIQIIIDILNREKKLNLKNFGSFKIIEKKARIGRNPKNKEEYEISARKSIIFKTSEKLKKEINSDQFD